MLALSALCVDTFESAAPCCCLCLPPPLRTWPVSLTLPWGPWGPTRWSTPCCESHAHTSAQVSLWGGSLYLTPKFVLSRYYWFCGVCVFVCLFVCQSGGVRRSLAGGQQFSQKLFCLWSSRTATRGHCCCGELLWAGCLASTETEVHTHTHWTCTHTHWTCTHTHTHWTCTCTLLLKGQLTQITHVSILAAVWDFHILLVRDGLTSNVPELHSTPWSSVQPLDPPDRRAQPPPTPGHNHTGNSCSLELDLETLLSQKYSGEVESDVTVKNISEESVEDVHSLQTLNRRTLEVFYFVLTSCFFLHRQWGTTLCSLNASLPL